MASVHPLQHVHEHDRKHVDDRRRQHRGQDKHYFHALYLKISLVQRCINMAEDSSTFYLTLDTDRAGKPILSPNMGTRGITTAKHIHQICML